MRRPLSIQVFVVVPIGRYGQCSFCSGSLVLNLLYLTSVKESPGALEQQESFESAAIREVQEETSIPLSVVVSAGYEQSFPIKPEWRKLYGHGPMHNITPEHT